MLVANDRDKAESRHASKHPGSDIGTTGVIADKFRKKFFAPVRSSKARLNRYVRNRESPNRTPILSDR
jgi:hypothetical protein